MFLGRHSGPACLLHVFAVTGFNYKWEFYFSNLTANRQVDYTGYAGGTWDGEVNANSG